MGLCPERPLLLEARGCWRHGVAGGTGLLEARGAGNGSCGHFYGALERIATLHVFIFEFVSGGGYFRLPGSPLPSGSLFREGAAMLAAVAEDFATRTEPTQVTVLADVRLPPLGVTCGWRSLAVDSRESLDARLAEMAGQADRVLIIAPELGNQLFEVTRWVERAGGVLISPCSALIAWASDKHVTCQRLAAAGIPSCSGRLIKSANEWAIDGAYPQVVKPRWGAGSEGVCRLESAADWSRIDWNHGEFRIEPFYSGRAASLGLFCGPGPQVALPPCWQHLSEDGRFDYRGGSLIQDAVVIQRAVRLGQRVAAQLRAAVGYVGIDLLLGETARDDRVVEINPRLTSSYVGVRRAITENLADGMIAVGAGERFDWTWRDRRVTFSA